MQTIQSEVRAFIVENFLFGQDDGQLNVTASFLETGIIDSTGVLELVGFLEERYGIVVADEDLIPANLDSVDSVARFVKRKRQSRESLAS